MEPRNHEEHIEHSFDSYCKRCLKRNALDLQRKDRQRREREVTISELSVSELAGLAAADEYFTDEYVFDILGESVGVKDCELGEALTALPADRRDIILMSYFFDMTDKEIAEHLKMARRTVAYKRTSTISELKKIMESEE